MAWRSLPLLLLLPPQGGDRMESEFKSQENKLHPHPRPQQVGSSLGRGALLQG